MPAVKILNWEILHDPLGEDGGVPHGAQFTSMEFGLTLNVGSWAAGTVARASGQEYTVTERRTVVDKSGRHYKFDKSGKVMYEVAAQPAQRGRPRGDEPRPIKPKKEPGKPGRPRKNRESST